MKDYKRPLFAKTRKAKQQQKCFVEGCSYVGAALKIGKSTKWFLNEPPCVLASFTHDVQLESSQKLTSIASSPVSFTL